MRARVLDVVDLVKVSDPVNPIFLFNKVTRKIASKHQSDHYTELQIPIANLATYMHLNLDNWYHKLNVSKTELKIHPQPPCSSSES